MYIPHRQSSVVTFEIKPKWGSLPQWLLGWSVISSHPIEAVEQTKCRFCIQQYKKLRSGKATSLSLYCPLRLFSTATNQMQSFLDLMKTPQNNFGVFVDGSRQHLDAVCIPINEAALDNLLSDLGLLPCPPYSSEMAVAILLTTAVQQRNVLNDLLSVQVNAFVALLSRTRATGTRKWPWIITTITWMMGLEGKNSRHFSSAEERETAPLWFLCTSQALWRKCIPLPAS